MSDTDHYCTQPVSSGVTGPLLDVVMILILWPVAIVSAILLATALLVLWPFSPLIYWWYRRRVGMENNEPNNAQ